MPRGRPGYPGSGTCIIAESPCLVSPSPLSIRAALPQVVRSSVAKDAAHARTAAAAAAEAEVARRQAEAVERQAEVARAEAERLRARVAAMDRALSESAAQASRSRGLYLS